MENKEANLLLSMASIVAAGVLARDDVSIENARTVARKIVAISREIVEECKAEAEKF